MEIRVDPCGISSVGFWYCREQTYSCFSFERRAPAGEDKTQDWEEIGSGAGKRRVLFNSEGSTERLVVWGSVRGFGVDSGEVLGGSGREELFLVFFPFGSEESTAFFEGPSRDNVRFLGVGGRIFAILISSSSSGGESARIVDSTTVVSRSCWTSRETFEKVPCGSMEGVSSGWTWAWKCVNTESKEGKTTRIMKQAQ